MPLFESQPNPEENPQNPEVPAANPPTGEVPKKERLFDQMTSEEQKYFRLQIDLIKSGSIRAEQCAVEEIENHFGSDAFVELLMDEVLAGSVDYYLALKILGEKGVSQIIPFMERLMVSEDFLQATVNDRSASVLLLEILSRAKSDSSIAPISIFVSKRIELLDSLVKRFPDVIQGDFAMANLDIATAMGVLNKFEQPAAFQALKELYEKFSVVKKSLEVARASVKERLPELLNGPVDLPELEPSDRLSDEEYDWVANLFDTGPFSPSAAGWFGEEHWVVGEYRERIQREPKEFQARIASQIYREIKGGAYANIGRGMIFLADLSMEAALPVYKRLLLDSASDGRALYSKDILRIIKSQNSPEVPRLIAEFARISAEHVVTNSDFPPDSPGADQEIIWRNNVVSGIVALGKIKTPEAERLRNILTASYPELSGGYDLAFPYMEKPLSPERRQWKHRAMYIKGSALFAEMLGRGREKVKDIDIFLTNPDSVATDESMKIAVFKNIEEVRPVLDETEFLRLENWVKKNSYEDRPIHLVRVSDSHLHLESTFYEEPSVLLWDEFMEVDISAGYYARRKEDLERYLAGTLSHDQLPEILVPNGTLARALRAMELSERFDLEFDSTILDQAEQSARANKLVISSFPINRSSFRREFQGTEAVDSIFTKVFEDKKLRKTLLRRYPRLGQIAEEVSAAGGPEEYIRKNFGEVYIQTRGFVRLNDIKLSKSPASFDRQKEFLGVWYSELGSREYTLEKVESVSSEVNLPASPELGSLIEQDRANKSLERRKEKNNFLDKICGRYRLLLRSEESRLLKAKVDTFLGIMNLEWPAGVDRNKDKVTKTLIKLGVSPQNPILGQFEQGKEHSLDLVISSDLKDILQASTLKPWTSCVNLSGGAYKFGLYEDVANASVVAYLMDGDRFVARKIIRSGLTVNDFRPAAFAEKLYGDGRYDQAMQEAVNKVISGGGILTDQPMMTYPFAPDAYFDSHTGMSPAGNVFYNIRGR
ncbi:MAG: hypothetical protein G01um101419_53 [Parcubacteria group bacterium Gr01-1014_19]|nr:MAG: hypothetical protein G01um101419_53 [Parcubacteria group bacterium Gr01-1014_19]